MRVGRALREVDGYVVVLVLLALAGQLFASYDFNLLVLTIPDIARDLGLSATAVGLLAFFIYAGEFVVTLVAGYAMDLWGRKRVWQVNLIGTAVATGLTYFVTDYWQLVAVRTVASAFAVAEFAMAATLVSEQTPRRWRGLLYSVVNGGYALGLLLASLIYTAFIGLGWRVVFAWGVVPILVLVFARRWLRESDRWLHLREIKRARAAGDDATTRRLLDRYQVDVAELDQPRVRQLFATPGPIRRQLGLLTGVWLCYATSYVATNVYITYWLTHYAGWTSGQAAFLLLLAGGVGFGFYVLGGALGELWGRREAMLCAGVLVAPLNLAFFFFSYGAHGWTATVFVLWFFIYQATNGVWSGAGQGYWYWPESFPTRVRGTAVGWLGAMFAAGLLIGSGLWTALIGTAGPVITWLVVAVGIAVGQNLAFALKHIPPNQKLETIST